MYRDMIIDETRKIALIIAKLMGIKEEGTKQEFADEFEKVLKEEYEAELEALINLSEEEFKSLVNSGRYNAEKLNALSQLLYVFAEPFNNGADTKLLLKKVMIIFDVLEQKHRFQSFDNISKRNAIYRYFEKNHE